MDIPTVLVNNAARVVPENHDFVLGLDHLKYSNRRTDTLGVLDLVLGVKIFYIKCWSMLSSHFTMM